MNTIDQHLNLFMAKVELAGELCYLNHKYELPPPAVEYLCQYVENKENNTVNDLLRIPVCEECVAALYHGDWILFYCLNCTASQWQLKSRSNIYYPEWQNILYFAMCPECYED